MSKPLVVAHRGVATAAAQNTIEAFTDAIAAGADMIEFDVRRTSEGELIVFHDAHVGAAATGDLTRDEVESAKGVRPPLFAEVLEACAGKIRLDVELKEDGYVPEAMALLRAALGKAGAEVAEQVVTSFLPAVVAQAKGAFPEVRTGLLVGTDGPFYRLRQHYRQLFPVGLARQVRADYLAPSYKLARYGVVARAAAAGLPCLLWTVNDDAGITRFARDPRVAAIITDRAARAVALTALSQARLRLLLSGSRLGASRVRRGGELDETRDHGGHRGPRWRDEGGRVLRPERPAGGIRRDPGADPGDRPGARLSAQQRGKGADGGPGRCVRPDHRPAGPGAQHRVLLHAAAVGDPGGPDAAPRDAGLQHGRGHRGRGRPLRAVVGAAARGRRVRRRPAAR